MKTLKLKFKAMLIGLLLVACGSSYAANMPTRVDVKYSDWFIAVASEKANAFRDMVRVVCWSKEGAKRATWVTKPYEYLESTRELEGKRCKGRGGDGFVHIALVNPDTGEWHRVAKLRRCKGEGEQMRYATIWSKSRNNKKANVTSKCVNRNTVTLWRNYHGPE